MTPLFKARPRYPDTPFTNQTTVTITHNFGIYPNVQVVDTLGAVITPNNTVTDPVTKNSTTITFDPPGNSGTVILT